MLKKTIAENLKKKLQIYNISEMYTLYKHVCNLLIVYWMKEMKEF